MRDAADLVPSPAAERKAMARKLAELGMRLAEKLVEDVEADASPVADPALAFSRLSRAVRLTLALEEKFEQGGTVKTQAPGFSRIRGVILKDEAGHRVREMIELEAEERGETFEAERLLRELDERLDDDEDLEDFAYLPLHESVRRLCTDLGVTFDADLWQDLACEDVAKFPGNYEPLFSAHPREGGDPGFLLNSAADREKSLGPRLREDEREGVESGGLSRDPDPSPAPT
jgi:hypothetical protein